jgi:hypothetical protein
MSAAVMQPIRVRAAAQARLQWRIYWEAARHDYGLTASDREILRVKATLWRRRARQILRRAGGAP